MALSGLAGNTVLLLVGHPICASVCVGLGTSLGLTLSLSAFKKFGLTSLFLILVVLLGPFGAIFIIVVIVELWWWHVGALLQLSCHGVDQVGELNEVLEDRIL